MSSDVKVQKQLNRNLCVGLILLGVVSFYDEEEIAKDSFLKHIKNALDSKHNPLKNGTKKEILSANEIHTKKLMSITHDLKKRKRIIDDFKRAARSIYAKRAYFNEHTKISDSAFEELGKNMPDDYSVSASAMLFALLRKNSEVVKWYKINTKKVAIQQKIDMKNNGFTMSSSRFIDTLLQNMDNQIENHVFAEE